MDRRFGLGFAVAIVLGAALLPAAPASAAPDAPRAIGVLEWHLGDFFIAGFNPADAPAVASSGGGERIEVSAMGYIDVPAGTATGSGTYFRWDAAGNPVEAGRIDVTGLIAFRSFGNGVPQGLPAVFEGGFAAMRATLRPAGGEGGSAVLWVESPLGKVPPGHDDALRLALPGGPNFNTAVRGGALFLDTA